MAKGAITVKIDGQYDDKDINRAIKDLQALKAQGSPTGEAVDGISGSLKKLAIAAGGMYALKEVAGFLTDSVAAAAADEAELSKLNNTLTNLGFGAQTAELAAWVDQLQYSANVSEGELRPALGVLVTATKDVTRAQDLMTLALDLSASGFGSTQDAANALAKAISTGNVARLNAFTKGGLDPAIIKSKDLDGALQQLSSTFGGAAAARAGTLTSKLEGLKIAAGELQESLGQGIIDGFVEALGGSKGSIDDAEASMRNMQGTVTDLGEAIGGLGAGALGVFGTMREVVVTVVYNIVQTLNELYMAYINVADALGIMSDEEALLERTRMAAVYDAQERAYQEDLLGSSMAKTASATDGAAASATGFAGATAGATVAAEEATTAAQALLDSTKALDAQWAVKESRFAFLDYLDTVNSKLDKGSKSLDAHTSAGRTNQRVLMEGYSTLVTSVQRWAEETDASQAEVNVKMATGVAALRRKWKESGLSKADIDKWLGTNTEWDPGLAALVRKAHDMGIEIGEALGDGSVEGLRSRIGAMQAMATTAVNKMTAAARDAGLIQSPSKVWFGIGTNLVDGLILGMQSKDDKVKQAATDMMNGIYNKASEILAKWDQTLIDLKGKLDSAKQAVVDWAKSTSQTLFSAFDISGVFASSVDENGNFVASKFTAGFDKAMEQFQWYTNVLTAIKAAGGSDALLQFLMSQGVEKGGLYGQGLIDNGLIPYMNDKLGLVQTTADTTAQAMVPAFLTAGVAQAQAMYDGFKANYGAGGPARVALENLMNHIAKSLERTVTITVRTVYEAAGIEGERAMGGAVSANKAYLVGEKGPEILVLGGTDGTIIPNGGLPTASGSFGSSRSGGNTYSIVVQAGVGDPRQIGQQVVEYIKRFESASGPVFAAA